MKSGAWWTRRNERGGTLALTAVMIVGLLSVLALAIDLGMLYRTKGQAQRAADAAALAGASAFLDIDPTTAAVGEATLRAKVLAGRNTLTGGAIDTAGEVQVEVFPAFGEESVRVRVQRAAVQTWFARMFGVSSTPVGAVAVARALPAGETKCVMPFALPDYWDEGGPGGNGDDANNNGYMDGQGRNGEDWTFDPANGGDDYSVANPSTGSGTGLGSDFRNGMTSPLTNRRYNRDQGRQVELKLQSQQTLAPGYYNLWDMPGGSQGGQDVRNNIANCNPNPIQLGQTYMSKQGGTNGPVRQGMQDRVERDPAAQWWENDLDGDGMIELNGSNGPEFGVNNSVASPNWLASPRVVIVPLMEPSYASSGRHEIQFNSFALMWLDPVNGNGQAEVSARFIMRDVPGTGSGPTTSPTVKYLRLIR